MAQKFTESNSYVHCEPAADLIERELPDGRLMLIDGHSGAELTTPELIDLVQRILDSYLKCWAGFVGLGKEVNGPDRRIAEVADWWLVYHPGEREFARDIWEWAGRGNPWPANRAMQEWLFARVFSALKACSLLGRTRLEAAQRLVERWNPFPFDPRAKVIWRRLTAERRKQLLEDRADWAIEACEALAKQSHRRWRFDRRWLKDTRGRVALRTLDELPLPTPVRALRNAVRKKFEAEILQDAATYRDRDAAELALGADLSDLEVFDDRAVDPRRDLSELCSRPELAPRERELFQLLAKGYSRPEAAARMKIAPSTARVLFHRAKQKFHRM